MIICDIDGCLFNNYHRADLIPEDKSTVDNWRAFNNACSGDFAIHDVINFVIHLQLNSGDDLVFLTARDWSIFDETLEQLQIYFEGVIYSVYMRDEDDRRTSIEYKKEALGVLSPRFTKSSVLIDDNEGIIAMAAKHFPELNRILLPSFDCCNVKK